MLKKEKMVMDYIFDKSNGKDSVLISFKEITDVLTKNLLETSDVEIDEIMQNLSLDGYINVILSDKKGKPIYCVSLDKKGVSWRRDAENRRKTTIMLVVRTVLLAVLSFAVGLILKAVFK